ncbi:PREDICTED: transcription repressor OFP8 [Erythranthe guttata]|uniref:transcription repressor OFP8 n=1 Tax=Erythranthe guttata TaxID=4155 RepID=UPI00064DBCF3|nr:PREDICTED: transcription repressor OFP8 [Erythranthe guttata]|eukprot:XP_012854472.1 PREDICTED: transcription repressor OFP8 [Erythranthe guttata]
MAENRLKFHIRRIFRSPLASCKSKDQISDVVETNHHHHGRRRHHQLVELFSPAAAQHRSSSSPANKLLFLSPDVNGRKCPPASPIFSPLNNSYYDFPKQKKKKKGRSIIAYENKYNNLFISDENQEEEQEAEHERAALFRRRSTAATTRRRMEAAAAEDDTLAVVKRSSDPYSDFRTSMVEMIVEKEIFAAKDLQNLLQCFLSLNSCRHHKVIFQVFAEIWEALLLP